MVADRTGAPLADGARPTPFQRHWLALAQRWGVEVACPHVVELDGEALTAPVLLRGFGARRGMLLATDWAVFREQHQALADAGYGFSTLSEPPEEPHPGADEAFVEMLADWGWTGTGDPPAWLSA